nr:FGGY-family carbohydrate kinase [Paenibacillus tianmuensis]
MVAGGAIKSQLWRQIIADVTGHPVVCPKHDVEANLGDVMLAGVGTGLLSWEELEKWQTLDKKVYPNEKAHRIYNQIYPVYRSSYLNLKSDMDVLAKL